MKLVAHASPRVLEAELLDRVAAARAADPLAGVLIVVPSRRLATHVTRRLAERFGALLGVSVLHHRALAERVLQHAGAGPRRLLDDNLLDTLFTRVVQRAAAGPLRDFVSEHPGAASALRETMTDLREAGIDPAEAVEALTGPEAETAALYVRWTEALLELAGASGVLDDAGLARAATAHAPAFAGRFATILHHGAYDLIGVRVDLVRALDRGRELTFLLPADPKDASGRFGVERARAIAGPGAPLAPGGSEGARPAVAFQNAQGPRAELRAAAYEALAAVEAGTPPHEVAVIVRSFGPYAGAMDTLLHGAGPRWHTSYTRPLRSDPLAAAALRAIGAGADGGPRRFGGHADDFEAIARAAGGLDPLSGLIGSLREVETLLRDERTVSRDVALAWLDGRADVATLQVPGGDGGGVRVLDAMQARGLTFSSLALVGMNAKIFPRVPHKDPFLPDEARARLAKATGRPLPMAGESDREERLLLAMLLRAAGRSLHVSWLRADDEARPIVPSLALRDVARFADPAAKPEDILGRARPIPAHPRSRLAAMARQPGLLSRDEETLLAALSSETGADAAPEVAARWPELAPGIALVAETETFDPTNGAYDGRIGVPVLRDAMAATALESLGRCPLQYFFRHVLRVEAPRTPPTPYESDAAARGSRVHDVLRRVYEGLRDEGAFDGHDVSARIARAQTILRDAWNASSTPDDAALAARFPVLDRIESDSWLAALGAFLEADLRRLAGAGNVPDAFEQDVRMPVPGGPAGLEIKARFDRVLKGPDGSIVSDYKTGGDLADRVKVGAMVSGTALQVPIYWLISGHPVELLGAGLNHDPEDDVPVFDGFDRDDQRAGFLETLGVIAELARSGRFPLRPGDHCRWCDLRSACRRGHPPTEHREEHAQDVADARDCWEKTAKAPTLAAVRKGSAT